MIHHRTYKVGNLLPNDRPNCPFAIERLLNFTQKIKYYKGYEYSDVYLWKNAFSSPIINNYWTLVNEKNLNEEK